MMIYSYLGEDKRKQHEGGLVKEDVEVHVDIFILVNDLYALLKQQKNYLSIIWNEKIKVFNGDWIKDSAWLIEPWKAGKRKSLLPSTDNLS